MNVIQMVATSGFLTVNKYIAREFGLDAAVLLGELASTQVYWEEQNKLDEDGMFYQTCEQITENTTLSKHQQARAAKILEDAGIIKTKKKGLPPMKYYVIDADKLMGVLNQRWLKNLTNVGEKIEPTSVKNFNPNNKRENKNKEIRKDNIPLTPITESSLSDPVKEKLIDFLAYRQEIKKPFKSERGVKSLVTNVERMERMHGAKAVIDCIDLTMANGWQGIIWDKIKTGDTLKGADAFFAAAMGEL